MLPMETRNKTIQLFLTMFTDYRLQVESVNTEDTRTLTDAIEEEAAAKDAMIFN